ncbi:hypothetical protein HK405_002278, partial [Cladochytrium tenue]
MLHSSVSTAARLVAPTSIRSSPKLAAALTPTTAMAPRRHAHGGRVKPPHPATAFILHKSDPARGGGAVAAGTRRPQPVSLRPAVYGRMRAALGTDETAAAATAEVKARLPADGAAAMTAAREAVQAGALVRREVWTEDRYGAFLERLRADGGDKIVRFRQNVLHAHYTRFVPLISQVKGLPLDDAILQLRWLRKNVSARMQKALANAIVKAKDEGLDLSKTYVADVFAAENGAVLSREFARRFVRGRGR